VWTFAVQVGMAEAAEMEREIHRMRLRLESLLRTQEKLVKDMELAIDKRESISLRFKAKRAAEHSAGDGAPPQTQVRVACGCSSAARCAAS
jgi:hypothetical protein